ncbi:MAG: M48 family metalloprotease, partial [Candidatus Aenigmarchaeota archaeon]|nr:M48 family metalloprotease [Candidatus Aenigmarchaeota archaeon]
MDLRVLGFLGMFTIVFSAMGALIGFLFLGVFGAIIVSGVFFVITLIIDFMSILRSQKPILRRFHAKESDDEKLNKIVEEMALNARVPKPKVYILQMDIPNSFSLGKNKKKASVCITEGALSMNKNEIKNIIAHEMFHIANEDTYIQSVAVALTNMLR